MYTITTLANEQRLSSEQWDALEARPPGLSDFDLPPEDLRQLLRRVLRQPVPLVRLDALCIACGALRCITGHVYCAREAE